MAASLEGGHVDPHGIMRLLVAARYLHRHVFLAQGDDMLRHMLICGAAMTLSVSVQARESVLLDFTAPTAKAGLTDVNPGDEAPTLPARDALIPAELVKVMAAEGSDILEVPRSVDRVAVPSWMRGKRNPFSRGSSAFVAAASASPDIARTCAADPYRPMRDLSREAEARRARHYGDVVAAACEVGIPARLFDALIVQESRYNPAALSSKGAIGMAQLMPETASYLGVSNPWDVAQNLRGGARYLKAQLDRFGRYDLALGAYNAGPGRITQYGGVPPFRETRNYVSTILRTVREGLYRRAAIMGGSASMGGAGGG